MCGQFGFGEMPKPSMIKLSSASNWMISKQSGGRVATGSLQHTRLFMELVDHVPGPKVLSKGPPLALFVPSPVVIQDRNPVYGRARGRLFSGALFAIPTRHSQQDRPTVLSCPVVVCVCVCVCIPVASACLCLDNIPACGWHAPVIIELRDLSTARPVLEVPLEVSCSSDTPKLCSSVTLRRLEARLEDCALPHRGATAWRAVAPGSVPPAWSWSARFQ